LRQRTKFWRKQNGNTNLIPISTTIFQKRFIWCKHFYMKYYSNKHIQIVQRNITSRTHFLNHPTRSKQSEIFAWMCMRACVVMHATTCTHDTTTPRRSRHAARDKSLVDILKTRAPPPASSSRPTSPPPAWRQRHATRWCGDHVRASTVAGVSGHSFVRATDQHKGGDWPPCASIMTGQMLQHARATRQQNKSTRLQS